MEASLAMTEIALPSGFQLRLTDNFSSERTSARIRELLSSDDEVASFRADPVGELSRLGIELPDTELDKVTDDDLLTAFGHRGGGETDGAVMIVVRVVIAVANKPKPLNDELTRPLPDDFPKDSPLRGSPKIQPKTLPDRINFKRS